jgi:SAM-dependent methyltransferase
LSAFQKKVQQSDFPLTCPACLSSVSEIRYVYQGGDQNETGESYFYLCHECSFIFARPVLIPELSQRQMDGVENAELFNSKLMKWLYIKLFIQQEISRIQKVFDGGTIRLLDVGCGTGWTSKVYKDHGFIVTGLEPSRVRAEIARERYGIEVINDYLENLSDEVGSYDVIVLRHIIEHLAEPDEIMKKVRALLTKDGIAVVIIPNINCLGRYLFDTNWTWVLPWHCNFFTPKSSKLFLERFGFKVLSQYQTPSPLYFPDSLLRRFPNSVLAKFIGKHKVAAMLTSAPVAVFGAMVQMGDNLNLFARKGE